MRPLMWFLIIILALALIVPYAAQKFIPKKEVVATAPEEPVLPAEEPVIRQIPEKEQYDIPFDKLQDMPAGPEDGTVEAGLQAQQAMIEEPLNEPGLTPEENEARALKRVEKRKFFEKIKRDRDGVNKCYQLRGAVFMPEEQPSGKTE